jgi:hypothetical protein
MQNEIDTTIQGAYKLIRLTNEILSIIEQLADIHSTNPDKMVQKLGNLNKDLLDKVKDLNSNLTDFSTRTEYI